MKTSSLKRIFIFSIALYLSSVTFTRILNQTHLDSLSKVLLGFPLVEWLERKDSIEFQICSLTSKDVAGLLKSNPDEYDGCSSGNEILNLIPKEYVVIRLKDVRGSAFGDLKCYFSNLPFPIVFFVHLHRMDRKLSKSEKLQAEGYSNIIFPVPASERGTPISVRLLWKNFYEY